MAAAADEEILVGAGTVLDVAHARMALDAGADFLVSPGIDEDLIHFASEREVTIIPGVATATEVMRARKLGLNVLKLFPARPLGGADVVKALAGPFPDTRFIPTGGIRFDDLQPLLTLPACSPAAVNSSLLDR